MNRILLIVLLAVAGCTTTEAVYKNYDTMVNLSDGVNAEEAKIIAQKNILNMQEKRNYRITAPDIKTTPQAERYPEYWFVVFGHNWFSPISMDPTAKTYTELRETQYLVVMSKADGIIKFSGEWYQKRQNDFDWIFNPEASKVANPLALPAGDDGHPVY